MKITMEGKYAYRADPTTEVRVLCVDAPGYHPVVSIDSKGRLCTHTDEGLYAGGSAKSKADLIPLQAKPRELWVLEHEGGKLSYVHYDTKPEFILYGTKPVRFVEQEPDQ